MKRVIGIIALVMAVLMLFAACGTGSGNKPATTAETSSAPASTAPESTAPAEPTADLTMAFLSWGAVPADLQLVEDELNKIVTPKINAKIKLMVINFGAAAQQYNLMLSSNEKLDLFITFPNTYTQLVAKGQIQEIGPLLDKYGQGVKEALGDYLKGSAVGGKIYGVRPYTDLAGGKGMLVRKDIVDKYQIDLSKVKDFQGVEEVLKAIKDKEPNSTPLGPSNTSSSIEEIARSVDGLGDNLGVLLNGGENLKVVNYYETDQYKNMINLLRSWYQKGYILKDAATTKEDQFSLVKSGKSYAYFCPTKPGQAQQDSAQLGVPLALAEMSGPTSSTSTITLFQWCVPNACKTPDKAVQMLNLMYTDAGVVNLLAWGIEGKHYAKKPDGTVGYPEGVTPETSGYNVQTPWMMGKAFLAHVWEGNPPDLWKQMDEWNKSSKLSKAMGFTYDPSAVKTEVAACTSVVDQYRKSLGSGSVDPNKILPEFISKLKASGIDKIVAEKQKQLDAWAAANNVK